MKSTDVAPPAIVRTFDAELEQLAFEIDSVLAIADEAAQKGAEHYRAAGEKLLRAKGKVPHGEWKKWLQQNVKRSHRQVQKWMQLAKSAPEALLEDQWAIISGHGPKVTDDEDEETDTSQEDASSEESQEETQESQNGQADEEPAEPDVILCEACKRKVRVHQELPRKCKDCKELRDAAEEENEAPEQEEPTKEPEKVQDDIEQDIPEHLLAVFEKAADFKTVITQLNLVNRELKDIAQHPAGAMLRLQQAEVDLKNLKRTVRFDKPYCVCPVCNGVPKGRKANCPCKARGWLTESSYEKLPSEYRK